LSNAAVARFTLVSCVLVLGGFFLDDLLPLAGYSLMLAGVVLSITSFALLIFRRSPSSSPTRFPNSIPQQTSGTRAQISQWWHRLRF
jgi:hypothetical protein